MLIFTKFKFLLFLIGILIIVLSQLLSSYRKFRFKKYDYWFFSFFYKLNILFIFTIKVERINDFFKYISKLFNKTLFKKFSDYNCNFCIINFILNMLEEIKFFEDLNLDITYSLFFTFLNMPSILFEIFPFIILISTQMFYASLLKR